MLISWACRAMELGSERAEGAGEVGLSARSPIVTSPWCKRCRVAPRHSAGCRALDTDRPIAELRMTLQAVGLEAVSGSSTCGGGSILGVGSSIGNFGCHLAAAERHWQQPKTRDLGSCEANFTIRGLSNSLGPTQGWTMTPPPRRHGEQIQAPRPSPQRAAGAGSCIQRCHQLRSEMCSIFFSCSASSMRSACEPSSNPMSTFRPSSRHGASPLAATAAPG